MKKEELRWFRVFTLVLICALTFVVRMMSIVRYESVIHEYDPFFQYRSTLYLVKHGVSAFLEWFDDASWYPIGRIIGTTCFPGLMFTAGLFHKVLNMLTLTISVRNVCVFVGPFMAALTALFGYLIGSELHDDVTGVICALLIGVVPGFASRSVAGSFDNEAVSIWALVATYYLWMRACRKGTLPAALGVALLYLYMAASWGGYVFITNLLPIYTVAHLVLYGFDAKVFVAYMTWFAVGLPLSMQVEFVGPTVIRSSEHLAAFVAFAFCVCAALHEVIARAVSGEQRQRVLRALLAGMVAAAFVLFAVLSSTSFLDHWLGRFYSFFDPTYAKKHIPIIASVAEHQPTAWSSYFFDMHLLSVLILPGIYIAFASLERRPQLRRRRLPTPITLAPRAALLVAIYGTFSMWFSGVMVRLVLVLAPISAILGAVALTAIFKAAGNAVRSAAPAERSERRSARFWAGIAGAGVGCVALLLYARHCVWVITTSYSSPSVVLIGGSGANAVYFDDYREAYSWLEYNTAPGSHIASWWDYGYQMTQMSNRTVLVDNNTWNTTHIGRVGAIMSSDEETAFRLAQELDVDYVLVTFGGVLGYSSDDINKFLWMVRISSNEHFPDIDEISEPDYFTSHGEYRVDKFASKRMRDSLMYRLCYHRFHTVRTSYQHPAGFDSVRKQTVPPLDTPLTRFEEVFTSRNWLIRIYRVARPGNWD